MDDAPQAECDAPLEWLFAAVDGVGRAAVPLNMMILGNRLAQARPLPLPLPTAAPAPAALAVARDPSPSPFTRKLVRARVWPRPTSRGARWAPSPLPRWW